MAREKSFVAIPKCFFCNEDKNEILLHKMFGDLSEVHGKVVDQVPCDKCKDLMKQGIILITCREPGPGDDPKNPWRTGGWFVVKEEPLRKALNNAPYVEEMMRRRAAFIPNDMAYGLGLCEPGSLPE